MNEKEEMPQVQEQIAGLEEGIQHLHDGITMLTTALAPILRDSAVDAEPKMDAARADVDLVPLAKDLRLLENKVTVETERIALLVQRSEL